jgi:hypothetical protein
VRRWWCGELKRTEAHELGRNCYACLLKFKSNTDRCVDVYKINQSIDTSGNFFVVNIRQTGVQSIDDISSYSSECSWRSNRMRLHQLFQVLQVSLFNVMSLCGFTWAKLDAQMLIGGSQPMTATLDCSHSISFTCELVCDMPHKRFCSFKVSSGELYGRVSGGHRA